MEGHSAGRGEVGESEFVVRPHAEEKCNKSCASYIVLVVLLVVAPAPASASASASAPAPTPASALCLAWANLWARMSLHTQKVKQRATEVRQQRCQIVGVAEGLFWSRVVGETAGNSRQQVLRCNF